MCNHAEQARDAYRDVTAARRAAVLSLETAPSDVADSLKKLAGQLLQQQLHLLTVDSHEADSVLLTKLLRTCIVTTCLAIIPSNAAGPGVGVDMHSLVAGTAALYFLLAQSLSRCWHT